MIGTFGRHRAQPPADLEPVHARQHQVEHHEIGLLPLEGGERGRAVGGERDTIARALKIAPDDIAHGWIVVNDEHALPHDASLRPHARHAHARASAVRDL